MNLLVERLANYHDPSLALWDGRWRAQDGFPAIAGPGLWCFSPRGSRLLLYLRGPV
jgi:hypothetical protein